MQFRRWWLALVAAALFWGANAQAQDANHLKDVVYGHKLGVALTMDVFKPEKPNGIGESGW